MNLFVSNLSFNVLTDELHALFAPYGEVLSAKIVMDKSTGRSRGFGFVEMANADDAQSAIASLEAYEMHGRAMRISEAKPRATYAPENPFKKIF